MKGLPGLVILLSIGPGIHKFLNPSFFVKITVFKKFYAVVAISDKFCEMAIIELKPLFLQKDIKIREYPY